jgi:hypothetical protein
MTEPKTVDEIMGLVHLIATATFSITIEKAEGELEAAITALAAERDQAVKDKRKMAERVELYSDELKAIRHTIVSTIGGVDEEGFPTSELNWLQRLRILLETEKERDALKARVVELEKAIDKSWARDDGDWTTCSHCHAGGWGGPVHEPGCIVRTIGTEEKR